MKIFIIILNWNGKKFISGCLDSVKDLRFMNYELGIVVVDNASTDGSDREVEENYKDVKLIRNQENLGFAEGNNVGIRYALENGADWILLLNSDTIVDQDLVVSLISASGRCAFGGKVAESDSKIGILGPKIYFAPGFEFHKDRYSKREIGKVIWYAGGLIDWDNVLASHRGVDEVDQGQYNKEEETEFVSGCCMLVRRKVFEEVGFLDEKYFLYFEDNDFCQRAKKSGFKLYWVPEGKVFHFNAGSSSSGSPLQDYYITRNRLLFGMRYAPLRAKLALLRESLKLLLGGRKWQRKGVFDFYLRKFGKGSYRG